MKKFLFYFVILAIPYSAFGINHKTPEKDFSNIEYVKSILHAMAEKDQSLRNKSLHSNKITEIDQKHTDVMYELLKYHPWFPISKFGKLAASNASLIVQHSPDLALQKKVLRLMEKYMATKDLHLQGYALLYDRVAMSENRPQKYATQFFVNKDNQLELYVLEDKKNLNALRQSMGLPPFKDYVKQIKKMYPQKILLPDTFSE